MPKHITAREKGLRYFLITKGRASINCTSYVVSGRTLFEIKTKLAVARVSQIMLTTETQKRRNLLKNTPTEMVAATISVLHRKIYGSLISFTTPPKKERHPRDSITALIITGRIINNIKFRSWSI